MKDRKNNNKSSSFRSATNGRNSERNNSVNSYTSSVNGTNLGNDRRIGSVTNTTDNSFRNTASNTTNSYRNSMNNSINRSDCISGVTCEVDKCYYHIAGNKCGAPSINIQCKSASTVEETDCSTFRLK